MPNISMPHRLRAWIFALVLGTVLSGCALAPGMRFEVVTTDYSAEPNDAQILQPVSAPEPVQDPDRPAIQLSAINPQTIKGLQAQRSGQLQTVQELMVRSTPYTIGVGDVLGITVWDHPQLAFPVQAGAGGGGQDTGVIPVGYLVGEEGTIQFPYVGDFKVQGLTAHQAREALIKPLSKYIKNPQITLRVQAYRSQKIYIDGEVRTPGQHFISDSPMSLAEALSRAGGSTGNADTSKISIIREGREYQVDLPRTVQMGINPSNIMLTHGDLVRVAHRDETKIAVLGEIVRPGSMPMRNGRLSLADALSEAGGLNVNSANARQVYVIRSAGLEAAPWVYHINTRSPAMLALADQFELHAKDIVYVDPAPLAMWNRVISLLLPSGGLTQSVVDTAESVK
ncbi:MAG: hypothetical protein RJB34_1261 [Pseudomonadota bacterium]